VRVEDHFLTVLTRVTLDTCDLCTLSPVHCIVVQLIYLGFRLSGQYNRYSNVVNNNIQIYVHGTLVQFIYLTEISVLMNITAYNNVPDVQMYGPYGAHALT